MGLTLYGSNFGLTPLPYPGEKVKQITYKK